MIPHRPRGGLLGLPPRGPPNMDMQHQLRGFLPPNPQTGPPPMPLPLGPHLMGQQNTNMVPPPGVGVGNMLPPPNQVPPNMRPPFVPPVPMPNRPPFNMNIPPPTNGPPQMQMPAPPFVDPNGDLWLEAKTGEGKVYYYNARTRESKWSKPDSTAEEKPKIETEATASEENDNPADESKPDAQEENAAATPMSAADTDANTSPVIPSVTSAPATQQMPVRPLNPPGFPMPRMPFPPPIGIPPPNLLGLGLPLRPVGPQQSTQHDWAEHRLPDGRVYYHNAKTMKSTWEKPNSPQKATDGMQKDATLEVPQPVMTAQPNATVPADVESSAKVDIVEVAPEKTLPHKPVSMLAPPSKEKPIANVPIPGTVWHIVWTGDSKQFFYNLTTKASVWDRPPDLVNSEIADRLLQIGPPSGPEAPPIVLNPVAAVVVVEEDGPSSAKKARSSPESTDLMETEQTLSPPGEAPADDGQPTEEQEVELKRQNMTTEERMEEFRNLLLEKGVSAFSTWEKELHKIVFDKRYMILNMKERKHCFDKFVRSRADEERKEKKTKAKNRKDDFKKLLEEAVVNTRMTFNDFLLKYGKEESFKAIEKAKEREGLFNEYMLVYRRTTKERAVQKDETLKADFVEMLKEVKSISKSSHWRKVKHSLEKDARFKAIDNPVQREEWFHEYVEAISKSPSQLEEERQKQKEKARQERIEASIRHREEEVRNRKEEIAKECEKERDVHLHDKAIQHFRALMEDMVRDSDVKWKETRRMLRKDPRWQNVKPIEKPEREKLFNDHIYMLIHKKKDQFRTLLDEAQAPLDARWKDVKRKIRDDPRYSKFGSSETREREFHDYMQERLVNVKSDFRSLLRETKTITYKTKRKVEDNSHLLKDIVEILKKDKRYLILDSMPDERAKLLKSYLDELYKKGPPPPPTATHPSSRYRKD